MVTDVRIDVGNFVGAGQPQMTFIATHNIWVQADFSENNLGHLEVGDDVELAFDALPGTVVKGQVREIGYGVSVDSTPLGSLPSISNQRQWLRDEQRFPVKVELQQALDPDQLRVLKVRSQASVIAFTGDHALLNPLGRLYIRAAAWLSYAY